MPQNDCAREQKRVRVVLEVVAGPHQGARFEFQHHDTFLVGRGTWSHLCLQDDLHFSRHHFRIEIRPPDCYLIDLGSRNGTFVNGNRVSAAFLRDGDVISGGRTEIQVTVSEILMHWPNNTPTVLSSLGSTATCLAKLAGDDDDDGSTDKTKLAAPFAGIEEVPGYELIEQLGGGSMGVVFRGVHRSTGQAVAIKLITRSQLAPEHAIRLFVREAGLLGRLDHPHIVRCLDFGYAATQLFLVMEYVPSITLESVLANQSTSSRVRIACAIGCQLLKALAHAHLMSIVHRDIKPDNVLLYRSGPKLNAKLADFGLAKNYAYAGLGEISREGDIRGTIAYMPPELVVDCRNARPSGDIYSVGATLYFYLSGEYPFDFANRNKLLVVLEEDPVPLRKRAPHVPAGLAEVVHQAMAKEPGRRFSSAREMLAALEPFATGRRKRH